MTEFYCCTEFAEFCDLDEYTIKEMQQILGIRHCPFCGFKLSMLT